MSIVVWKHFSFDAAHQLPNHKGKCARYHGHTYLLDVAVSTDWSPEAMNLYKEQGFFVDFADLKAAVKSILDKYWDHYFLNDTLKAFLPLDAPYTTIENLVQIMFRQIQNELGIRGIKVSVHRVVMHETPDSWAEWRP